MIYELLESGTTRISYTESSWTSDRMKLEPDLTKLEELGIKPKVDLEDGLSELIEWCVMETREPGEGEM